MRNVTKEDDEVSGTPVQFQTRERAQSRYVMKLNVGDRRLGESFEHSTPMPPPSPLTTSQSVSAISSAPMSEKFVRLSTEAHEL